MINIVSENNIKNGQIVTKFFLEELLKQNIAEIYEVIRVIYKRPIFLREHYERMIKSLRLSDLKSIIEFSNFKNSIELLIKSNDFENCNIRVSYFIQDEPINLMYYVKSSYPSEDLYQNGINVVSVKKQRKNPNVKFYESSFRDSIDKTLSEKEAFEAILVNNDDTISEGSKSNVFFIKERKLITSVDGEVLLGVTRDKVINVCEKSGIEVEKRSIHITELKDFDGAFITGTSINVLSIKSFDDILYNSSNNEILKKVSDLYVNEMMQNTNSM